MFDFWRKWRRTMTDKAVEYLCLARKAGLLHLGEERCLQAAESGKARLLLLPSDVSPAAEKRALRALEGRRAPLEHLPWTNERLCDLLGKSGCGMLCFTDLPLASRFSSAMAEELPPWRATAELLSRRV